MHDPNAGSVQPEGAPRSTSTADPNLIHSLQQAKAEAQAAESPWLQKLLQVAIDLLTGQPVSLQESGNYTKQQTAQILGTTYQFTETLAGSVSITGTPQ